MQPHHNRTATLSAIAGFIIMFLLAGLFAEKSHEGHLPEQNNRAATSIPMAAGIVAVAVVLTLPTTGIARGRNSTSYNTVPDHSQNNALLSGDVMISPEGIGQTGHVPPFFRRLFPASLFMKEQIRIRFTPCLVLVRGTLHGRRT